MGKKLFVGGLDFKIGDTELRTAFEEVGPVASAKVIQDRDTGRSRGFGFVEMTTDEDAQEAKTRLNGQKVGERAIYIDEAKERQ